jgi:hypothetical protein
VPAKRPTRRQPLQWQKRIVPTGDQLVPIWDDARQRIRLAAAVDDQLYLFVLEGDELRAEGAVTLPPGSHQLGLVCAPKRGLGVYGQTVQGDAQQAFVAFIAGTELAEPSTFELSESAAMDACLAYDPDEGQLMVVLRDGTCAACRGRKWGWKEHPGGETEQLLFAPGVGFVALGRRGSYRVLRGKKWVEIAKPTSSYPSLFVDGTGTLCAIDRSTVARYDPSGDTWSEPATLDGWAPGSFSRPESSRWAIQDRVVDDRHGRRLLAFGTTVDGEHHQWTVLDLAAARATPGPATAKASHDNTALANGAWVASGSSLWEVTSSGLRRAGDLPAFGGQLVTDGCELWIHHTGRLAKRDGDGWKLLQREIGGGPVGTKTVMSVDGALVVVGQTKTGGPSALVNTGKGWKSSSKYPARAAALATRAGETWVLSPDRSHPSIAVQAPSGTWKVLSTELKPANPYAFFYDAATQQLILATPTDDEELVLSSLDADRVWQPIARLELQHGIAFDVATRSLRAVVRDGVIGDFRLPLGELLDATGIVPFSIAAAPAGKASKPAKAKAPRRAR